MTEQRKEGQRRHARARQRAYRRLGDEFSARFRELLEEEKKREGLARQVLVPR